MNKKLIAKIKKVSKPVRTPKQINAFNPVLKERDMVRECINDGAHGSHFMETRTK
jgi:hypothetical protein